ncbi:protein kinase and PP2C-like domain-containing protein [Pyrus communis]|uniref:protein kinase and PP2C-like domain-containing protein n=1 Tax=Pyrus communis TaxID=23211 RepID=UPI0035C0DBF8
MNYKEQQLTAAVVSDGLRPVLADPESRVPSTLLSLILRCWDANSQNMPSFDVIVTKLAIILEQGKKRKEPDISFHDSLNSLGNQPRDVANNLEAYQEGINWFTEGEIPSKELVNLSMVWKCGFGLQMILWHIILYFLGDPLLHVAEGRPWRTHISFSHTCVMKGISMFLVLFMVIEVQQLLNFQLELFQDSCKL